MRQLSDGKPITIHGYLMPWYPDTRQPPFIFIEKEEWLPIFSTEEKLMEFMAETPGIRGGWVIKSITDGKEFLSGLELQGVRVCADPYTTPEGNTRFRLVTADALCYSYGGLVHATH